MTLLSSRLLQLLGLLVALAGLLGYWWSRDDALPPATAEAALLNPGGETFQASFVVAGRDIDYAVPAQGPIYNSRGEITGWRTPPRGVHYGFRTDSIFYVNLVGNRAYLIALPRDIYLESYGRRLNTVYGLRGDQGGADGLRRAVSELLGVGVEYYAVINIDLYERFVDAVGGVNVNVPQRMFYVDNAAGLRIDLQPGLQHLDGEGAAGFVRYRETLPGGDLGRADNLKRLAHALLNRLRELNVRAVALLPELAATLLDEVETNANAALVRRFLPRLNNLELVTATVPVAPYGAALRVEPGEVERFLAQTFGGEARTFEGVPEATLLISNRSGEEDLEEVYRARLLAMGVPKEAIATRILPPDASASRVQAELERWDEAGFYASLFNLGRAQVHRLNPPRGVQAGLELVLGADASSALPPLAQGE